MNKVLKSLYYRVKNRFERKIWVDKLGIVEAGYPQMLLEQLYTLKVELVDLKQVVDVGTNEGMFSRSISTIFPNLNFYCIEPNVELNGKIKKNLLGNKFVIINELVSSENKKVVFSIHADSQMSSILDVQEQELKKNFNWDDPSQIKKVEMRTTTLDEVFVKNDISAKKKTLLKIDTQGNELDVLKGANECLTWVDYIIVEYMFDSPYIGEVTSNDLFQHLFERKFLLCGPTMIANRLDGKIGAVNFLFKKVK
ncbi:MAG: FkbM family methyltransferase [Flavobacteriales bacterium]|nr:FkbM family methyltransferase [Flavobacteriales bacterium]